MSMYFTYFRPNNFDQSGGGWGGFGSGEFDSCNPTRSYDGDLSTYAGTMQVTKGNSVWVSFNTYQSQVINTDIQDSISKSLSSYDVAYASSLPNYAIPYGAEFIVWLRATKFTDTPTLSLNTGTAGFTSSTTWKRDMQEGITYIFIGATPDMSWSYDTIFNNNITQLAQNSSITLTMKNNSSGGILSKLLEWNLYETGLLVFFKIPISCKEVVNGQAPNYYVVDYNTTKQYSILASSGYNPSDYDLIIHKGNSNQITAVSVENDSLYFDILASEGIEFSISFKPYTYTISYNLNDDTQYPASIGGTNSTSYTVETDSFTLTNPTRPGYTFKGWSGTGLTEDTNKTVTISKGSTGDRAYIANWEPNYIYFRYHSNNGSQENIFKELKVDANSTWPFSHIDYIQEGNGEQPEYEQTYIGYSGTGYYTGLSTGGGVKVHQNQEFDNYLTLCNAYDGLDPYEAYHYLDIYCQWIPQILVSYDSIFSYFNWYRQEISGRNNCNISDITDTGFTITCINGGEGTVTSPEFLVTENQSYKVDVNIPYGNNWDIYFFVWKENYGWLHDHPEDFEDQRWHFSSGTSKIFTIPEGFTKAAIRCDANGLNNTVRFENFRIYPADYYYMGYSIPSDKASERTDSGSWSLPTTPVRNNSFYEFIGWSEKPVIDSLDDLYPTNGDFPTENKVLYSQWKKKSPRMYYQVEDVLGGKPILRAQLQNKLIRKAFIYITPDNGGSGTWKEV